MRLAYISVGLWPTLPRPPKTAKTRTSRVSPLKPDQHVKLSCMTKSGGTVNIHEAKTHLSRIIEQVLASGEPVTIARAGKPVVIVSAHPESRPSRRTLGILRGKVRLPEDLGAQDAEIQKMFEAERR
jgi:prevent-host-death family protein